MRTQDDQHLIAPETLLLVPFVLVLVGLLLYFFVEILPTVRVLPG